VLLDEVGLADAVLERLAAALGEHGGHRAIS
jgi:hypothetical protein